MERKFDTSSANSRRVIVDGKGIPVTPSWSQAHRSGRVVGEIVGLNDGKVDGAIDGALVDLLPPAFASFRLR